LSSTSDYAPNTNQLLINCSFITHSLALSLALFFSRKELLIPDQRHPSSVFVCYLDTFSSPARLTAEQVPWVLNCQMHDVPVLVTARLLRPLDNPQKNGIKFFTTADLLGVGQGQGLAACASWTGGKQAYQRKICPFFASASIYG